MDQSKLKIVFWLFVTSIIIELFQLVTKFFTLFYFNLFRLAVSVLLVTCLGYLLKANKTFLVIFLLVSLFLVGTAYVLVWN